MSTTSETTALQRLYAVVGEFQDAATAVGLTSSHGDEPWGAAACIDDMARAAIDVSGELWRVLTGYADRADCGDGGCRYPAALCEAAQGDLRIARGWSWVGSSRCEDASAVVARVVRQADAVAVAIADVRKELDDPEADASRDAALLRLVASAAGALGRIVKDAAERGTSATASCRRKLAVGGSRLAKAGAVAWTRAGRFERGDVGPEAEAAVEQGRDERGAGMGTADEIAWARWRRAVEHLARTAHELVPIEGLEDGSWGTRSGVDALADAAAKAAYQLNTLFGPLAWCVERGGNSVSDGGHVKALCGTAIGWLLCARVKNGRAEAGAGYGSPTVEAAVENTEAVAVAAAEAWEAFFRDGPERTRDRETLRLLGVAAESLARLLRDAATRSPASAACREKLRLGGDALTVAAGCVERLLAAPETGDVTGERGGDGWEMPGEAPWLMETRVPVAVTLAGRLRVLTVGSNGSGGGRRCLVACAAGLGCGAVVGVLSVAMGIEAWWVPAIGAALLELWVMLRGRTTRD